MKNPFVLMALLAAAMQEAFRENRLRDLGLPVGGSGRRSRGPTGKRNPPGSKFLLRAFKAKHGHKADSVAQAREWYATYLAEQDANVRRMDAERKARRAPSMKWAA